VQDLHDGPKTTLPIIHCYTIMVQINSKPIRKTNYQYVRQLIAVSFYRYFQSSQV